MSNIILDLSEYMGTTVKKTAKISQDLQGIQHMG